MTEDQGLRIIGALAQIDRTLLALFFAIMAHAIVTACKR